jgi:hypothetical protein
VLPRCRRRVPPCYVLRRDSPLSLLATILREEEEGLFKANAVNDEDPERDRATVPRRGGAVLKNGENRPTFLNKNVFLRGGDGPPACGAIPRRSGPKQPQNPPTRHIPRCCGAGRPRVQRGSIIPRRAFPRQKPTSAERRPHRPELRGVDQPKKGEGGGVCDPRVFCASKTRAFWLGGVSGGGQLPEDRRAQGQ